MSNADLADFADKETIGTRSGATGWIVPALAWGLALAILAFGVPKFEAIFRDFGLELSLMMNLVVQVSHQPLVLGVAVVFVLLVNWKVLKELSRLKDAQGLAHSWSAMMIGLPLFVVAFMVIAIGATLTSLLLKLS